VNDAVSFLWRWELAGHPRDAEAIWLESSGAKDFAMAADARPTSHPIRQPVADESEAMVAFDTITHTKGQAFIRQLEAYLGEAAFRDASRPSISVNFALVIDAVSAASSAVA
jgi:aminopeptidase N